MRTHPQNVPTVPRRNAAVTPSHPPAPALPTIKGQPQEAGPHGLGLVTAFLPAPLLGASGYRAGLGPIEILRPQTVNVVDDV